jgi:hypothetical protein
LKLEIEPRENSISQTFEGNIQHRTEVVRVMISWQRVYQYIIKSNLHREVKLLIGMDLFKQLEFKLKNVSFLWSNQLNEIKELDGSIIERSKEKLTGIY